MLRLTADKVARKIDRHRFGTALPTVVAVDLGAPLDGGWAGGPEELGPHVILNRKARLYPGEPDNHTVAFSIAKNRAGPTGIELEFDLERERFRFDPQGRIRC